MVTHVHVTCIWVANLLPSTSRYDVFCADNWMTHCTTLRLCAILIELPLAGDPYPAVQHMLDVYNDTYAVKQRNVRKAYCRPIILPLDGVIVDVYQNTNFHPAVFETCSARLSYEM